MEGLIIFIIMGIIGSLLSKNKQKAEKPMPPFNNKPNTTSFDQYPEPKVEPKQTRTTVKTLEDFAKEVFEQLNEKSTQPKEVFREPQYKDVVKVEPKVEPVPTKPIKLESTVPKNSNSSNRPSLDENRSSKKSNKPIMKDAIKQNEIGSYVPNTKQALIQAIVASEIIGPPKAKQR